MLLKPERGLITTELTTVLQNSANIPVAIGTIFQADQSTVLPAIPPGVASHADAANLVVGRCLADRWARNPSLLEALVSNLIARGMKVAELTHIRDRIRARIDPNLDPVMSSWITAELPFFGRTHTRQFIKSLLDSGEVPILLVDGKQGSGKTYTVDWLGYVSHPDRCNVRFVALRLEEKTGATMLPDVLAETLVARLGQTIDHNVTPDQQRYEQRLCNWLVSKVLIGQDVTWIALDGFDDPDLHLGSQKLLQLLAESLMQGELNKRVRLLLLGFKTTLTQVRTERVGRDDLPDPAALQAIELEDCLRQHFADIKQDVDDSFIETMAAKLLADAAQLATKPEFQAEPRLKLLNMTVYKLRQADLKKIGRIA